MQHIKLLEDYFYGQEGNSGIPNSGKEAELYFNMLPRGLRNELTRPVKDMLMNTNVKDWHVLEFILPKIEKLMAKSGLQWNRFPGMIAKIPESGTVFVEIDGVELSFFVYKYDLIGDLVDLGFVDLASVIVPTPTLCPSSNSPIAT